MSFEVLRSLLNLPSFSDFLFSISLTNLVVCLSHKSDQYDSLYINQYDSLYIIFSSIN